MSSITWYEIFIYGGLLLAGLGIWIMALNALEDDDER